MNLDVVGTEVLPWKRRTPCYGVAQLIATGPCDVRGDVIECARVDAEGHFLEDVWIVVRHAVTHSTRGVTRNVSLFLCGERCPGASMVIVVYIVKFFKEREHLLAQLWIWLVCLLG